MLERGLAEVSPIPPPVELSEGPKKGRKRGGKLRNSSSDSGPGSVGFGSLTLPRELVERINGIFGEFRGK